MAVLRSLADIRIRTVAVILLAVTISLGAAMVIEIGRIGAHARFVAENWEKFDAERSERTRLEDVLASSTGFGGFIHYFKNYVLRGGDADAGRAREALGVVFQAIKAYRRLELSPIDTAALDDIEKTFRDYSERLNVAVQMRDVGQSALAIDAVVRTDDRAAIEGIERLRRQTVYEVIGGEDHLRPGKFLLLGQLRIALGYGGLVHCFRNYVLRREEPDLQCAYEKAQDAQDLISDYRAAGVNQTEAFALADLATMVGALESAMDLMASFRPMTVESLPPLDMDGRLAINETPGLSAFVTLRRELTREQESRAQRVETALHALNRETRLSHWAVVLGTVTTLSFLAFAFFMLVMRPIGRLTDATRRLAEGEGIDVPYVGQKNEVGTMARALTVFKANAERTREAERQLADNALTLKRQLTASRAIQDTVERQAQETERLNDVLKTEHDKLEQVHAFLDVVMNSLSQGVVVFDTENRIVRANDAFIKLLRLPPDWLAEDRTMEDYIRLCASRGDLGPGIVDDIVRERMARVVTLGAKIWNRYERTLHDGTVLEVFGERLPDGGVVATYSDVTERKRAEERIRAMALTDPLTGLANRNQFGLRLDDAIKISRREDLRVGLMLLDLDKFKAVNDTHGHPMGDALLIEVARRLQRIVREVDTVARLGGDEFAVIFPMVQAKDELSYPASRMVASLTEPIAVNGAILQIGTSIGIAFFPDHAGSPEALTKCADEALYTAKAAGRGRFVFYDDLPKPAAAQA
ncbi:MAG: diguanylate cyclase [Alphaproteobacteria bacterium]